MDEDEREKIDHLQTIYDTTPRTKKDDKSWHKFFEEMKQYKEERHTIKIQKRDIENRHLYDWSARQHKSAKENRLPLDKKELLIRLGFVFSDNSNEAEDPREIIYTKKQDEDWDKMYEKLVDYKDRHGHCRVSFNDTDRCLATWVSRQRSLFNKRKLGPNRVRRLDTIGFVWKIRLKNRNNEDVES